WSGVVVGKNRQDCRELPVSNISQNVELLIKTNVLLKLNDNVCGACQSTTLLQSILIITFLAIRNAQTWKVTQNIACIYEYVRLTAACVYNDGDAVGHIVVKSVYVMRLSSGGTTVLAAATSCKKDIVSPLVLFAREYRI